MLDTNMAERIARYAGRRPILEIGAGLGHLTIQLAEFASEVLAVEIDSRLTALLREALEGTTNVRIVQANVLELDLRKVLGSATQWVTISNLGYSTAQPIILFLLESTSLFEEFYLTVQREVADRLRAAPGNKTYGRLSVVTQRICRVKRLFDIPPEAFYPRPKVMSSLIHLAPHGEYPLNEEEAAHFERLVKGAFASRRKTLRNNLRILYPEPRVLAALHTAGVDPTRRAESLAVEDFVNLTRHLMNPT